MRVRGFAVCDRMLRAWLLPFLFGVGAPEPQLRSSARVTQFDAAWEDDRNKCPGGHSFFKNWHKGSSPRVAKIGPIRPTAAAQLAQGHGGVAEKRHSRHS